MREVPQPSDCCPHPPPIRLRHHGLHDLFEIDHAHQCGYRLAAQQGRVDVVTNGVWRDPAAWVAGDVEPPGLGQKTEPDPVGLRAFAPGALAPVREGPAPPKEVTLGKEGIPCRSISGRPVLHPDLGRAKLSRHQLLPSKG